jgi:hypothetical protein
MTGDGAALPLGAIILMSIALRHLNATRATKYLKYW